MKFEEALHHFKCEIEKEYGLTDSIVKIGIEPDLLNRVVGDLYKEGKSIRFTPAQFGEFILNGVQLVPRRKDKF